MRYLLITLISTCCTFYINAKDIEAYVICNEDNTPVTGAIVSVFTGDSITMTYQTDKNGSFSFPASDSHDADIELIISALDFVDEEKHIDKSSLELPLTIYMRKDKFYTDLSEVVVSADKGQTVKRTSNGQIFYLSKDAKKEHNPFLALMEIPLLISDYTTSTVKLKDGKRPLILIDGNQVNSGIRYNDTGLIWLILLGELMIVLGRTATDFIRRWLLLHITMRINISLVSDFFIKLLKLPMSFFDSKLMGNLMQRINDHTRVQDFLAGQVLNIVFSILSLVVFGIVLLIYAHLSF